MADSTNTVMVVAAHPDDAEFGVAGTVAKWTAEGKEVVYVVCTNGDKGSVEPEMTSERLAAIREDEQLAAARVLGVKEVVFLRHPDGYLEDTPQFRGELVRLIRRYRPYLVMTSDPYRRYVWHRDHRIAGRVTLDAVYPYARDRLNYPEHKAEGLLPHKVREVYLWGAEEPDTFIDINDTFDIKLAALRCHTSQVSHMFTEAETWIRQRAADMGRDRGIALAEAFLRVEVRY